MSIMNQNSHSIFIIADFLKRRRPHLTRRFLRCYPYEAMPSLFQGEGSVGVKKKLLRERQLIAVAVIVAAKVGKEMLEKVMEKVILEAEAVVGAAAQAAAA